MRLSDAITATLEESRLAFTSVIISEEGEGPRWKFDYDKYRLDPSPDILLLGAYEHPNTGNELVGGINLHYLNRRERDQLAKQLPKIMGGNNLYDRYWIGRRVAPQIFQEYYRTYNAKYVRGVETDIMYPKYGVMQATKQWFKKKLGGMFKSKAQRQKEAQPKYPQDLASMQDTLDQVVQRLQQQRPQRPTEPETPEIRAARNAFLKFQRERTTQGVEQQENEPLQQSQDRAQEPEPEVKSDPRLAQQMLQQHREQNRQELTNPKNDIDLGDENAMRTLRGPDDEEEEDITTHLGEQIAYYSPICGHVVFEPFHKAIAHDNRPIVFSEGWGNRRTLEGEYWLSDDSALFAENDHDHTVHAIRMARSLIGDGLGLLYDEEDDDWEGACVEIVERNAELAPDIWSREGVIRSWSGPRPKLENFLSQYGISMELWDVANWIGDIDPRLYAAQHWGWVRNEGNNLETYDISRSKLKTIANGLYDAYQHEDLELQSFDIYVYNTKRFYHDVPFDVIEAGDIAALRDYDEHQRGVA